MLVVSLQHSTLHVLPERFVRTVTACLLESLASNPSKARFFASIWIPINLSGYLKIKQTKRDTESSLRPSLLLHKFSHCGA